MVCGILVGGYQFWGFYNGYMVSFGKFSVLSPLVTDYNTHSHLRSSNSENTDKSAQVELTTKSAVHLCILVSYSENTQGTLEI